LIRFRTPRDLGCFASDPPISDSGSVADGQTEVIIGGVRYRTIGAEQLAADGGGPAAGVADERPG
jgi:hypothetical protein